MRLTKAEKKYYKKQLSLKLDALGVKSETNFKGTGKFETRIIVNPNYDKDKPMNDENSMYLQQKIEKMQRSNVYKNLIKTLIRQADVNVIEKFLAADIKINPKEEVSDEQEKVDI